MKNKLLYLAFAATLTISMQLNSMQWDDTSSSNNSCELSMHNHIIALISNDHFDALLQTLDDEDFSQFYWHDCFATLIKNDQFELLQKLVDLVSSHSVNHAIKIHADLVDYIQSLSSDEIKRIYHLRDDSPSTINIALQLVFAKKTDLNLGERHCVWFLDRSFFWVNGTNLGKRTNLLSQPYLRYTLALLRPILEPITNKHHCTLGNIVRLEIDDCGLNVLPDSIGTLVHLEQLWVSQNKLTDLPESLFTLTQLQKLFLQDNHLTTLPNAIGNLLNLQKLDLNNNELITLPEEIGNLVNLQDLDLSNNQLTTLPQSLEHLVNLKDLFVFGNPLTPETQEWLKLTFGDKVHFKKRELRW